MAELERNSEAISLWCPGTIPRVKKSRTRGVFVGSEPLKEALALDADLRSRTFKELVAELPATPELRALGFPTTP